MDLTNLKELLTEDDAVSPVIGVILMVAITVILAAVIASFVLGLGDTASQTTPQASFSWDYEQDNPSDTTGNVTITHDGGDSIPAQELYVRGDFDDSANTTAGPWGSYANATVSGDSKVTAGQTIDPGVGNAYELRVIYETQEGDNSATLAEDSGPEA
ncbi:type IV pilin [Haloarcula sp. AONF1]